MPSVSLWMTSSALSCSRTCNSSSMKSSFVCSVRKSSAKSLRARSSSGSRLRSRSSARASARSGTGCLPACKRVSCSSDLSLSSARLSALLPSSNTVPLSATAPSSVATCARSSSISLRAASASVEALHGLGAVVDLLAEVGEGLLELGELARELVVRRALVGAPRPAWLAFRRGPVAPAPMRGAADTSRAARETQPASDAGFAHRKWNQLMRLQLRTVGHTRTWK